MVENIGQGPIDPSKIIDLRPKKQDSKQANVEQGQSGHDATAKENKQLYSKAAQSQQEVIANQKGSESKALENQSSKQNQAKAEQSDKQLPSGLNKEYVIENPKLYSELKTRGQKKKLPSGDKDKKNPPKMSLRTRLSPKGAINPKENLGEIPGRLKSVKDFNKMSQLEEAVRMLESRLPHEDPNLITQYAQKLLSENQEMRNMKSLAQLLNLDESIAAKSPLEIRTLLEEVLRSPELNPDLIDALSKLIGLLEQNTSTLRPLILLFLPYPFPFIDLNLDDEFLEDEEELLDDEFADELKEDESEEEGLEDDEQEDEFDQDESEEDLQKIINADQGSSTRQALRINPDVEASISVRTHNFGKLHFHLVHDETINKFKLSIKGHEDAEDLACAIESNLEFCAKGANFVQDEVRQWHDNVLQITESRIMQVNSKGQLNENFMRACNSIMETILENDFEIREEEFEAEYNIL